MCFLNILACSLASLILVQPLEEEHEVVNLSMEEQIFEADYYFEKTGEPKGGIILAHGGNHVKLASNLGYTLSQHGWSVLILTQTQNQSQQDQDKIENPVSVQLSAAVEFMETKKGLFNLVLLSSGPSWPNVSRYLMDAQSKTESIRGLILHNAQRTMDIKDLNDNLAILDLVTHRAPTFAYQGRKLHAKRFKMSNYQQLNLHLPQNLVLYGEDKLSRRIRGWLRIHVQGVEIEKKT
jgi:hypothetical protein